MANGLPQTLSRKVQGYKEIVRGTQLLLFLRPAGAFFRRRTFLRFTTMDTCIIMPALESIQNVSDVSEDIEDGPGHMTDKL